MSSSNARWYKGSPDRYLFVAMFEEKISIPEIAKTFKIGESHAFKLAVRFGLRPGLPPVSPVPAKMRNCLRCRVTFKSEGRHNHLCKPCNERIARQGASIG